MYFFLNIFIVTRKYLHYTSMLTKNLTSSEITLKKQSKTIYLNFIAQQQAVQQGCLGQVKLESGSGGNNPSSQIINLLEGAVNTTTTERDEQLASTACPVLSRSEEHTSELQSPQ